MGRSSFPMMGDTVDQGLVWRAEVGLGMGIFHPFAMVQTGFFNATDPYTQAELTGTIQVPGDFQLTRVGVGSHFLAPVGRFQFGGRAELGLLQFSSPIEEESWAEIQAEYGTQGELGPSAMGVAVGGGGQAGVAIIPEHAWLSLHADVAYDVLGPLGLEIGARVGISGAI